MRQGKWSHAAVALAAACALAPRAAADPLTAVGRAVRSGPSPRGLAFAQSVGYGYTGDVLGEDDSHHRLSASLVGEVRPWAWLASGLRFDGRFDGHSTGDDGWVGDPHLYLRAGARAGDLRFGARVSCWFPGADAPSIVFDAASVDLLATASWSRGGFTLLANAGFRRDRSARSAMSADRLSEADRLSLGVSEFDAALFAANLSWRGARSEVFAEWSWDRLIGDGAPDGWASPMRLGAGVRRAVTGGWTLEALVEADPGDRPSLVPGAPLVPIEPRVSALVGVTYLPSSRPSRVAPSQEPLPVVPAAPGTITGHVRGADAGPLAAASVRAGDVSVDTDPQGGFVLSAIAAGELELSASAPGFQTGTQRVTLAPGGSVDVELVLSPELPDGQIRGVVRSFDGKPLSAKVIIEPLGTRVHVDSDGSFRVDVPPGRYQIVVSASGYATQRRKARVEEQGVVILNVELSRK